LNTRARASLARTAAIVACIVVTLAPSAAVEAQAQPKPYAPQIGQPGKDVIWVPTPDELVERMLRMAQTTANDYVVDLGSGDGRIAIAAAKNFGARSLGIEYDPDMVELSNRRAAMQGVTARAHFTRADIFEADFSQATVVTMYLLPQLNLKLRPKILEMRPGTRVVAHQFNMDGWQPDETTSLEGRVAYLWIVPAKVQGAWYVQAGDEAFDLTLEQHFQMIEGSVKLGSVAAGLRDTRLEGERIQFTFVDNDGARHDFSGRVGDGTMEGSAKREGGAETAWRAVRR